MRGCPNSQSVSCQRCTSVETIGKFAMSHGSLENWPIYRLVTRWARGWKSRIESNPENYCALVHVVQVSLIHVDVNSNRGYIYMCIFFFFDESAKIPVKSHWRDFYLRGTRVCSYGIYFNILLMRILSDRLCKKKILSIFSSDISTCEYNLNILFYELLFCYHVVNYDCYICVGLIMMKAWK